MTLDFQFARATTNIRFSWKMCKLLLPIALFALLLLQITYAQSDDSNPEKDPLAEACRKQLNTCLDQAESRKPGAFDMDHCCDEYKKCMAKIGRNRQ